MKKRAMSAVVTTLIIILLAIVALGIVWVVVKNVLNKGAEKVSLSSLTLDLEINKAFVKDGNLSIGVKRGKGEADIVGINFIISDGKNSVVLERQTNINELEMRTFNFVLNELAVNEITSIKIAPIIELKPGKTTTTSIPIDRVDYEKGELGSGKGTDFEEESEEEWNITCEEQSVFVNETKQYNTSQKILNLINNNFTIISRDDSIIFPAIITYQNKQGTKTDLLRMAFKILLSNTYNGMVLVYEYDNEQEFVLNFRDLDVPKYFYFEEEIMKLGIHGWSFNELMDFEEQRRNILIDRFGIFFEGDLLGNQNLTIQDVEEWNEI